MIRKHWKCYATFININFSYERQSRRFFNFFFSKKYIRSIEKFQSISNFACVIMRKKGKRRIGYKLIGRLQQTVQSMFEQESAQDGEHTCVCTCINWAIDQDVLHWRTFTCLFVPFVFIRYDFANRSVVLNIVESVV